MAEKLTTTPGKSPRRPGRPTRAEATAKALAAIGVDPATIDPRRVLASIAVDPSAPASARVAACRALLVGERDQDSEVIGDAARINDRAIARMRAN